VGEKEKKTHGGQGNMKRGHGEAYLSWILGKTSTRGRGGGLGEVSAVFPAMKGKDEAWAMGGRRGEKKLELITHSLGDEKEETALTPDPNRRKGENSGRAPNLELQSETLPW